MKKRLLSTFTAMAMVCSTAVSMPTLDICSSAREYCSGNFNQNFTLSGDGGWDMKEIAFAQLGENGASLGYTEEWCADFVTDCAVLAGQSEAIPNTEISAGCDELYELIRKAGGEPVSAADAECGDLIFYGSSSDLTHVEIIYSQTGSSLYSISSIGGNCGNKDNSLSAVHDHPSQGSSPVPCKIIRPNYSSNPRSSSPIGCVDEITVNGSSVHVRGWAYDPDDLNANLEIHVYAGNKGVNEIVANLDSSDIPVGGKHRFDKWVNMGSLGVSGSQLITVFAIDKTGDDNTVIGNKSVYFGASTANFPKDFKAMIVHVGTGKPIMQDNSGNVVLTTESRTNYDAALWHFMKNEDDGTYSIYSYKNGSGRGKALTVTGNSSSDGAKMICADHPTLSAGQRYTFLVRNSDGTLRIDPVCAKDKCLELTNGKTSDGTAVQIRTADGTAQQKFKVVILDANRDKIDYRLNADKTAVVQGSKVNITVGGQTPYVLDYKFYITDPKGKQTVVDNYCNPVYSFNPSIVGTYSVYAMLKSPVQESIESYAKNKVVKIKVTCAHTYTNKVVAPTCKSQGYTTHTCSKCGYSFNDTYKAKTAHKYTTKVVAPTTTAQGYTLHICSVCGDSYKDTYTPAQGQEMTAGAGKTVPDGDYVIISELSRDLFLDIPGTDFPDTLNRELQVYTYSPAALPDANNKFDTWTVKYLNNGYYKIIQNEACGSEIALTVKNNSKDYGALVTDSKYTGATSQQWSITATDHGYTLQARNSGWYLDVIDGKTDNGTKVRVLKGNGAKAQSWCFVPNVSNDRPIKDGEYYIKSALGDNVYLDVSGDYDYKNNSNVQLWSGKKDIFEVKYYGDGYYTITEKTSGLAVDVENPADSTFLARGRNVSLYTLGSGKRNQLWKIVDEGKGNYRFVSRSSGYSLNVKDSGTADGTNVNVYTYNTSNAQFWSFVTAHDHEYTSKITKAATCTEDGIMTYTCSCGDSYTETIPAKDHKYTEKIVQPTTTEKGYTLHTCTVCGYSYKDKYTDPVEPSSEGECGENVSWVLDNNGTLTISGTGAMSGYGNSSKAPWYDSRESVKAIIIKNGVTSIGDFAFEKCENLTNVTISNSVTSIGRYTFFACKALKTIDIPDSITKIGDNAFYSCTGLTSIVIPNSVKKLGYTVFLSCDNLTSVTLPDNLTEISSCLFEHCKKLTNLTIPKTVTKIGSNAFYGCDRLEGITIPDNVKVIEERAFYNCKSMNSVTIPGSVTTIGEHAFGYNVSSDFKDYVKNESFKIICVKNTAGEQYAIDNGFAYETINSDPVTECTHSLTAYPAKAATCTANGNTAYWYCSKCKKYFSDRECTKEITLVSTVIKATGHKYTEKIVQPTTTEKGYTLHTCTVCGYSYKDNYVDPITAPKVPALTATAGEKSVILKWNPISTAEKYGIAGYVGGNWKLLDECYTISYELKTLKPGTNYKVAVVAMYDGKWNMDFSNAVTVALEECTIPKISYEKGSGSVKLTWTAVSTAEKYGIFEYEDDYWNRIAQTADTSYVLTGLASGSEHKIAVVTYSGGKWNTDFSNAIVVTPNAAAVSGHPKITDIEYNEQYHQFRLNWNAVTGATQYGIAVKVGGKWKVQAYTEKTYFTSPKLRQGSVVEMVICAKVNGEWDLSNINGRAFKVTVK